MKRSYKEIDVGNFEITSGKVIVSDPCYDREVSCMGGISDVKNGKWEASLYIFDEDDWGERVGYLRCYHKNYNFECSLRDSEWEVQNFTVGVDSGQAGVYDESQYHGGEDEYGEGGWYDINCNLTLANDKGGVLTGGVVSSSGFGDGSYECRVVKVNNKVVGILIDFGLENDKEE